MTGIGIYAPLMGGGGGPSPGNIYIGTPDVHPDAPGFTPYLIDPGPILIHFPAVDRPASAPGFYLVSTEQVPEVEMELLHYPDFDTVISDLELAFGISFTEQKSDVGSGQFSMFVNDSDHLNVVPGGDHFVRFKRWSIPAMVMACETYHKVARDANNKDANEVINWSGPGHAIILDDAVVYPALGLNVQPRQDDRNFNWTCVDFNDWWFTSPWSLGTWADYKAASNALGIDPIPGGIDHATDPFARAVSEDAIVLARPGSSVALADPGNDYIRQWVYVPVSWYYTLRGWADNTGEIYIDETQVLQLNDYPTQGDVVLFLSAGWHLFACHVQNYIRDGDYNPEGIAWSLHNSSGAFEDYTPIATSDMTAVGAWEMASPPGMFIGEILISILRAAQARGCFPTLRWTFSEVWDSAGNEWVRPNEVSTKVGTSYKEFILEMCQTWMDFRFQPGGLVMDAYTKDGLKTPTGIHWVDSDTILALEQDGGG